MKTIDEKIKQALSDEYNELIKQNDAIDANPFKQMKSGFDGKMKWMYLIVIVFTAFLAFMMFYSMYSFYHEAEVKSLIGWGVAIIMFGLMTQMSKMWYWSELGRNRVIREVKLLELQMAQLLKQQEK